MLSLMMDHQIQVSEFELQRYWKISTVVVNCIFLLDLLLNLFFLGIKKIAKEKKYLLLEVLLQLLAIVDYIIMHDDGIDRLSDGISIAMTVYLLRMVRILDFITEIQQFRIITSTLSKFTMPFLSITTNLFTLFYTYAFIGE